MEEIQGPWKVGWKSASMGGGGLSATAGGAPLKPPLSADSLVSAQRVSIAIFVGCVGRGASSWFRYWSEIHSSR